MGQISNMQKLYEQVYKPRENTPPKLEATYKLVVERSKAEFKKDIVNAEPRLKTGVDKKGAIRLQPSEKSFGENDFKSALSHIKVKIIDEIGAGQPESASSKYTTYKLKDKDGTVFRVVLGGGSFSNKGMTYERQLVEELKTAIEYQQENPLLTELEKLTGTHFVGIKTGFNKLVRRKLTGQPNDVGEEIADLILVGANGEDYFISLKDKNGKTLSNNGVAGIFKQVGDQIIPGFSQVVDTLFAAAKIDLNLAAQGLTSYLNNTVGGNPSPVDVTNNLSDQDKDTIMNYLASAIDFGYLYVKNLGKNKFKIVNLATLDDVKEFIGDIQSVQLKYPYYKDDTRMGKRKNLSIDIKTSNSRFSFDVRNASGDIIPKQINLVQP
jgi:hypothetical protein